MSKHHQDSEQNRLLEKILHEQRRTVQLLECVLALLVPPPLTGFTRIHEDSMVPLAAGSTATFSTTPIPATSAPIAANIVWTSSDTTNAPITPNPADPSGLSILVAFPSTVVAGLTFSLTVSYTNSDGTTATQTNSFTTVAAPSPDITGFTPITQTV